METRRIISTGLDIISPLGLDATTLWENLVAECSGARWAIFGLASSCATGADAIGQAFQAIRLGNAGRGL